MTTMPCISIRQPWAGLILVGGKDIENRTWRCPAKALGKTILIHAGKAGDYESAPDCLGLKAKHPDAFRPGGVVGIVRIVCQVQDSESRWAIPGEWHWVLADARPLPFFACPGRLGIFKVEYPHSFAS
jgi:hypothetical protein